MRRRLLASYLSITLFVLLALGLPLGVSYANTEHRRLENDVQQDAFGFSQRAGALVDEGEDAAARQKLDMIVDQYARDVGARVVVTDADGGVVAASSGAPRSAATPAMLLAQRGIEVTDSYIDSVLGDTIGVAVPVLADGKVEGAVQVRVVARPRPKRASSATGCCSPGSAA